jgi:DNA-binding transcriptional LysR family regulator
MISSSLRCFLTVAEMGSIREAAGRLRIAQSAVSRRIQNLELEMRVALFERSKRGVRLTSGGEVLLHHVREATRQTERLEADLDAVRGIRRGHVVVRVIEGFASSLLPGVLTTFRSRHPAVTLDIRVARTNSIADAVIDGNCHFGVTFSHSPDPRIIVLASMNEPLQAVLAPSHPLAKERSLNLKQLLPYPLAAPSARGGSRALFDSAWQAEKLVCKPVLETNSMHVLASFVQAGDGIAITSPNRAEPYLSFGQIVAIPIESQVLSRGRLELLARRQHRLPPAADAMARAISYVFN